MADMRQYGLVYLATPYSKYTDGLEQAFSDAARLAARLMQKGYRIYSPIVHCHPLARYGNIDPNASLWLANDEMMMNKSDTLFVAKLDGWQKSDGINSEIKFFDGAFKPVFTVTPDTLKLEPVRNVNQRST